jgi:hypothetical protein
MTGRCRPLRVTHHAARPRPWGIREGAGGPAAADEAGISRRYGGIHFRDGDLAARAMGRAVAAVVWEKARDYIEGTAGS